jgi:VCBS repeat-containing protein
LRFADSSARRHHLSRVWAALLAAALATFAGLAFAAGVGLRGQPGDSVPTCAGKRATIVGTGSANRLIGTRRGDVIVAGAGHDRVQGLAGADIVCGVDGEDRVSGGAGDDVIRGDRGDDRLAGGAGDDTLIGRQGADAILGGHGDDRIGGAGGDDRLRGDAGDDRIGGGPGRDECVGGRGTDLVTLCESGDEPAIPGPTLAPADQAPAAQVPAAAGDAATVPEDRAAPDQPPVAVDDNGTTDEDTTLNVAAPGVLANDTVLDPGDTKTVDRLNGSTMLTGTSAKGATVTINANGSYTYDPGTLFQGLSTGQSDTDSFTYRMSDGAGASSTATVHLTINGVSDAPTTNPDTFDAIGNTGLFAGTTRTANEAGKVVTGSVLGNDTDPDTPQANLVAEAVTDAPTTLGGTISIAADGNFTYHPDDGDTGVTDTFTYRVCDASPCNSGTVANATGTLNLPIAGQVWYVRNNAAAGGAGTSDTPFDTLAEAETASGNGDSVYIFDGDNTATNLSTGYAMDANERLIGEHSGISLDPDGGGPLGTVALHPGTPNAHPTLAATSEDVVVLASGATAQGINADPSGTGGGVSGGAGTSDVTIDDVNVIDAGTAGSRPGLELDGTGGTSNVSDLAVTTNGSTGVRLNNAGTVNFAPASAITIATTNARGLDASSTNMGTSTFDAITVTGSGDGGLSMVGTTGATTFNDLALTTTSGSTPAFALSNAGTVTVLTGGNANVSATGGPAIDVTATSGAALAFDAVSSTDSVNDGINLAGLGAGTFTAESGTVAGASGIAFDIEGGSGTVTYPGTLDNGPGHTVEIIGRSGGAVTLSGAIADTGDPGGGISLLGNTGGSTTLSNASKVLNTTTAPAAVSFSSSNGHTLTLSGGGLDIDTTTGAGLRATNSGTLVVSGTGNTIDTTTGPALNITSTDIGAADVTFQSISSNGAASGILLNTTGTAGSLAVTGTGGTCTNADTSGCSGGRIRNSAGVDSSSSTPGGTGIVLKDTTGPSLTRMWLHDHSNYAIRGTNVAGFTLANSVVNGANGDNGTTPFDDGGVILNNLTESASVTGSAISGGFEDDFRVNNTAGSLNRITFSSNTFGANTVGTGNDAIGLATSATAGQLHATIEDSTFTRAAGDHVDYSHNGTGTGDLDLTANNFSNSHPTIATGRGGLTLSNSGTSGNTTMDIDGNTFRDAVGPAVLIVKTTGPSTQTGTFTDNTLGVAEVPNSGSAEGSALKLQTAGQGTSNWAVTNNQIRGYNNFGIEVLAGGATAQSGAINTTITGNTITQPGNTAGTLSIPKQGVHFNIGTLPGDTYQACGVITGNSLATSGADSVPATGVDVDVRLRQQQSTTIRLPGYAGSATDTAAVQSFVAANNPGGTAVLAQINSRPGGGFTGGAPATCP